jgi:hypothetical protein
MAKMYRQTRLAKHIFFHIVFSAMKENPASGIARFIAAAT